MGAMLLWKKRVASSSLHIEKSATLAQNYP